MTENPLQQALLNVVRTQKSYVGELSYATEDDLSRAFGQLRRAVERERIAPDELVVYLENFGTALETVGKRYAQVLTFYERLYEEMALIALQESVSPVPVRFPVV